jgi:hypothetical protein
VREFLLRELRAVSNKVRFEAGADLFEFESEDTIKIPVENLDDNGPVTEMKKISDKKEKGFVLKTRVLGTKEEWERSKQCISVPKEARENVSLGPYYLTKNEGI